MRNLIWILGLSILALGCDEGKNMMKPVMQEPVTQETSNLENSEPEVIKLNEEELEEIYLTLPNFKETFLKGDGNVEAGMYQIQMPDFGNRIRLEKNDVVDTTLNLGYIQLNYGDVKNQYCNRIWIDEAILVFNINSPEFEIENDEPATLYHFDIQIIGARRAGKGVDIITLPDGNITLEPAKHEWQIAQTAEELEENCW